MNEEKYIEELKKCVRCGSCKAFCPTYDEDATESMGARGRLSLLLGLASGRLVPSQILNDRIFSCTLCGACTRLCPLGVDIKELIYHGRNILRKSDLMRRPLRILTKFFVKRPKLSFRLLSMSRNISLPLLSRTGLLPFKPELPDRQLRDSVHVVTVQNKKGRVAIFTGCSINFMYPHLGESLVNVLNLLGYEVVLPAGEFCCGAPLRTLGLEDEAVSCAEKNYGLFSKLNVEAVLSLCPTCTLTLKKEYPNLIGRGIDHALDISEFFIGKLDRFSSAGPSGFIRNALYHDPCHLQYGLGIKKEPREIIRSAGVDLLDTDGEHCCGFAGLFCFSNKELSKGFLNKCSQEYGKTEAASIITSCPGCILQLSREIRDKPVLHLIEIIEEALLQKS
jgi:glycolate oxidase iron-sulfur subunit